MQESRTIPRVQSQLREGLVLRGEHKAQGLAFCANGAGGGELVGLGVLAVAAQVQLGGEPGRTGRNHGRRLIRRGCELRLIRRDYELRLTRRDYELRLTRRGYELRLTRRGYELRLTRRSGTDSSIQKMELLRRGRHGACHGDELV